MTITLRPFLPADAPALRALFQNSIKELGEKEYSQSQCSAWAATADDCEAFTNRLATALTLVALDAGALAGFASLKADKIDLLYTHPSHARRGVATALIDAIETMAHARKIASLQTDASDCAQDFFTSRGYESQSRNSVTMDGEWLANTTMKKNLSSKAVG